MKVSGIIVRRRSMGKNLAFADVRLLTMLTADVDDDDDDDVDDAVLRGNDTVARGGVDTAGGSGGGGGDATPESNRDGGEGDPGGGACGDGDGGDRTVLRVAFRRASPSWDEEGSTTRGGGDDSDGGGGGGALLPFPAKASSLPHGATVWLELRRKRRPRPKPVREKSPVSSIPAPSIGGGVINEGGPTLEVRRWTILEHPGDTARRAAIIGFDGKSVGDVGGSGVSFPPNESEKDTSCRGISCSAYLRARGDAFTRLNRHPHQRSLEDGGAVPRRQQRPRSRPAELSEASAANHRSEPLVGAARQSVRMEGRRSESERRAAGHGDRKAKSLRARVFASWILETFGAEYLRRPMGDCCGADAVADGEWTGCTVLDVAGGRGQLSVELSVLGRVPCTVVDPLVRGKQVYDGGGGDNGGGRGRLLQMPKKERKRICRAGGPPPRHVATPFDEEALVRGNDGGGAGASSDLSDSVGGARCLVGLHPDEATEDILDVALRRGDVSVAIVPCCVFPGLFPMRRTRSGGTVRTYEEFMEYLLEKDHRLRRETLAFEGKNQVIYYKCTP